VVACGQRIKYLCCFKVKYITGTLNYGVVFNYRNLFKVLILQSVNVINKE